MSKVIKLKSKKWKLFTTTRVTLFKIARRVQICKQKYKILASSRHRVVFTNTKSAPYLYNASREHSQLLKMI